MSCTTSLRSEFTKVAIEQSHDCAKYLRICAIFFTNERKTGRTGSKFVFSSQFEQVLCFVAFLCMFQSKTFNQKIMTAQNNSLFDSLPVLSPAVPVTVPLTVPVLSLVNIAVSQKWLGVWPQRKTNQTKKQNNIK